MHRALGLLLLTAAPAALSAQTRPPAFEPATVPAESERDSVRYVLRGERHGPSFFPRVKHPEVEYVAGDRLTFDRYHTVDVMYTWLRRWAEKYPNLVELYQVGTSYEGRPILQLTLTNKSTGKPTDKPAAFFEGGRHSGEITSSESVLWLTQHLLENYGRDPKITKLLDTKTVYLRPQNNPDGSNLYLYTAQANRSSVRPVDNDGDGLFDEDPGNDINGDGVITQMRWRDTKNGDWIIDPKDKSGRLMKRVEPGKGQYRMAGEGIDDDGDGRVDEDGVGGLDLHRNYPENWRPDNGMENTGRGWTQGGAGAYPLSEPETFATVMFTLQNPHISVVNSMDTRVPMHLRPPSTSKSEERMYPDDLRHYLHFDSVGLRITGYPWAGDVYHTYATRNDTTGRATGSPLFGHGPDFGYFYYGAIWYGDELWDGGTVEDLNGDGVKDDFDRLIWIDSLNAGRSFIKWTKTKHPVHGDVEVGGWHPKFFSQNGPPEVLEKWARNQALFNLEMAFALPELELVDVQVKQVATKADSVTWEITPTWRNNGLLPTALKQAQLVKIVREDRIQLELPRDLVAGANPKLRVLAPARQNGVDVGYTDSGETKSGSIRVQTIGVGAPKVTVKVLSTRGGVLSREVTLQSTVSATQN